MKRKLAWAFLVGLPLLMLFGLIRTGGKNGLGRQEEYSKREVESRTGHDPTCLAEAHILGALQKLISAESQAEADQVRQFLLDDAGRSPHCRKQLIATLMRTMDKPNLDFKNDGDSFLLWRAGTELLGTLKATEALDLLIAHLDLSDGKFSTTMSQQPALKGVIRIGPSAVPKLAAVLRQSPDPNMRRYAVYCLTGIGGDSAESALEEALPSEPDACVSQFIRVSIETLNNKTTRYATDQYKWFSAFMCKE